MAQVRQSAQNRVGRLNEWAWHKLGSRLEIELAGLTSGLGTKLSGRLEIELAGLTSGVDADWTVGI